VTRLIVIRGNSGSGKTTLAHRLREELLGTGAANHVAVIEQDHFRRIVLKEREVDGSAARDLIELVVRFALGRGYVVILEGILSAAKYGPMVQALLASVPGSKAFYLDVPFDETVRRHATKPNAHEFGEAELRSWHLEHDVLGVACETVLPAIDGLEATLAAVRSRLAGGA
jgi:thymidylate kinase